MADDREMTVQEIAQETGIPANTIQYWIRNGLPAVKRGGIWWIKMSDLEQFMAENVEITKEYRLKNRPKD